MTTMTAAELRALLEKAPMDTPLDAEGYIAFGADGEVVAELSENDDAALIAAAVNHLPKLLDLWEACGPFRSGVLVPQSLHIQQGQQARLDEALAALEGES